MKKLTSSTRQGPFFLMTFGLYLYGALASEAAVTITITGELTGNTAEVSASGFLPLYNLGIGYTNRTAVQYTESSGQAQNFGTGDSASTVDEAHFRYEEWLNQAATISFTNNTLAYSYTDTSNGGSVIFGDSIDGMRFFSGTGVNNFFFSVSPFDLAASDINTNDRLNFSGAGTLNLGSSTFEDMFSVGTYTDPSGYNGESLTLNIVDAESVPEPSTALLFSLGGLAFFRRKRCAR